MTALDLPAGPWVVGHRGAAGEALENTLASVERAVNAGVQMVEVDLRLTADGRLVLFHDPSLERLGGRRIEIEASRWQEIRGIKIGSAPTTRNRIALLQDLLAAVPPRLPLNLEMKIAIASREQSAECLVAEIGTRRQVLVSSFDWDFLSALRRLAPSLPLAPISRDDPRGLLTAGRALDAWSLHCHHRIATRRLLASAQGDGRPVMAYAVNEPRRVRTLLRRGVRGIVTDEPTKVIRALQRWPA